MIAAGLLTAETLKAALLHCVCPFDQSRAGIANLKVGGRLPEENNPNRLAARVFPAQFAIGWIKVYCCAIGPEAGRVGMR